ncbi:MAG: hypothetical protein WBP94_16665 [Rhodomicrobiaceae bacterium]
MIDVMAAFPTSVESAEFADWTFLTAAVAGVAAGALYRMAALIVLSASCLVVVITSTLVHGWSFWQSILTLLGLLGSVQLGYLCGVGMTVLAQRVKVRMGIRSIFAALFKRDTAG